MKSKLTLAFTAAGLLAGCGTTQGTQDALTNRYLNTPVDNFFSSNGAPSGIYQRDDGGKIFTWSGGQATVGMPATTNLNMNPNGLGGYYGTATTYGGDSVNLGCVVQINTDKEGLIRHIGIQQDTVGMWKLSRCNELFSD